MKPGKKVRKRHLSHDAQVRLVKWLTLFTFEQGSILHFCCKPYKLNKLFRI